MKKFGIRRAAHIVVGLVAMLALAACGIGGTTGESSQEVVSTDLTAYQVGDNIIVDYSNMNGSTTDWISVALPSDAGDVYEAWKFTGGGTSGELTFTSPHLAPGTYVARAYYDWAGTSSYTIQQTSPSFTVAGSSTLAPSASSYAFGSDVTINYSGFSGSTTDWIAIFPPGAPNDPTGYVAWMYTGGGTAGSMVFSGLASGTYEARYFADWAGSQSFQAYAVSSQFTVGGHPTITTDFNTYGADQTVTAAYANLPGNPLDFIAVSVAGSPATSVVQRFYTNGQVNGTQGFIGLAPGQYEARAYVNDMFTILATHPFTVTGTSVTTDATQYSPTSTITVSYSGMPGNATDWVGIAPLGSSDLTYTQFMYTGGLTSGTAAFSGLPTGTYEARAYYNNMSVVEARSAPFTVQVTCTPPTTTPVFSSITTGDLVIDASTNTATATLTAPLDSSILITSLNENEPSPAYGGVTCDLTATGVTCQKYLAGTDSGSSTGVVNIHYYVITFTSGVLVQRGVANTNAANPTTVTLTTAVDPASSFVLMGGEFGGGSGWGNNEFVRGQLVDGSTLTVQNGMAGATLSWQVVQMVGASVQRGTTSFASGDLEHQVAIGSAPSGSLPLASYTTANQSGLAAATLMMQTSLLDDHTLDLKRSLGGTALDVSWEVVSLPYSTIPGVTNFAAMQTTSAQMLSGIDPTTSVALSSSQGILGQSGGSTTYNGTDIDLLGEAAATFVVSAGSLTVARATSQASSSMPWTVIDFAHNCAGQ